MVELPGSAHGAASRIGRVPKTCAQMTGLRVLLISPYPLQPDTVVGGVEAVASALAPAMAAQADVEQVTVLSFHRGQVASHRHKVNDKLELRYLRGQDRFVLPTRAFLEVWRASRVAREIGPDVVHGQGIGTPGYIATRLTPASVVTVHGLVHWEARLASGGGLADHVRFRLIDAMVRAVLRRASVVISTSFYDARSLNGLVRGKSVHIPNPVLPQFYARGDNTPEAARVLFAGMLVRRKNVEGLLRAFCMVVRRMPEARLVVVGPSPDPAYEREIHKTVRAMRMVNNVDFLGHVTNTRLLHEIRRCMGLVLFSTEETSPTIIAQAMAAGKPVVASRVGGIPEMVADGESGFLVAAGDEQALADRLGTLLGSRELCARMGAVAHTIARERFEPSSVALQTLEAYRLATRATDA